MKTTKLLVAVFAFTITASISMPIDKTNVNSNVAIVNAADNEFYAHNYGIDNNGYSALNTDKIAFGEISEIAYQKDLSHLSDEERKKIDNKICIFSVIQIQEGSNNSKSIHCVDYFIDKSEYDPDVEYKLYLINNSKNGFWINSDGHDNTAKYIAAHSYFDINGKFIPPSVSSELAPINQNRENGNLKNRYVLYGANNIKIYVRENIDPIGKNAPIGTFSPDGTFTLLDDVFKVGDVNCDHKIDIEDVNIITNHVNGVNPIDDKYFWLADVNGDNKADTEDISFIMNEINGVMPLEDAKGVKAVKYISFKSDEKTVTKDINSATPNKYSLGDVNNDGRIDAVDASSVLSYYAIISTNKDGSYNNDQMEAADVNHDGQINAVDASCILSYYAYVSTAKEDVKSLEEFLKK